MKVKKLARLRPMMPLETVASTFGKHWVAPGQDGYVTCTPGSVSARLDAEGRVGYITFLRTFPEHVVIEGLHIGMPLCAALATRPALQLAKRDADELADWSRYWDVTGDGHRLNVGVQDGVVRSIELSQALPVYRERELPVADPSLTRAFDLKLDPQQVLPMRARGTEWAGGWALGLPPGITPQQWPLSPVYGYPLRHAFTLHLPPEYRAQGQHLVGLSLFVDAQFEELDASDEISAFFDAPLSPEAPTDEAFLPFWQHLKARHPHQRDMEDDLGTRFTAIWLTQEEFDAQLCLPPPLDSAHLDDSPGWMTQSYADCLPDSWLYTRDEAISLDGAEVGCVSGVSIALPIRSAVRNNDPNVGKPPREWKRQCEASGYIPAYSDKGIELDLGRWTELAHLGGTMVPNQGYPDFGPYYLEFEEAFGGFNFGGGNAQLDLEKMQLDWACG